MKNEQLLAMVRSLQQSIDMRSNEAARTELERFKADLFSQSAMLHAVRNALLAAVESKTLYVIVATPDWDCASVCGSYLCRSDAELMCQRLRALSGGEKSRWVF